MGRPKADPVDVALDRYLGLNEDGRADFHRTLRRFDRAAQKAERVPAAARPRRGRLLKATAAAETV